MPFRATTAFFVCLVAVLVKTWRKRVLPIWGALVFFSSIGNATEYVPGETYFGRNDYIEYRAGNIPVILTAGHGGLLTPAEIPDRTFGVTAMDTNTRPLTDAMATELTRRTGLFPHVIISHLRRTKLDPNRELVEAAQGNEFAEQAWQEYHGFIERARAVAEEEFGFAFVVDVHGHGHDIQRLELGYGLGNAQLNLTDTQLEKPGFGWNSSLRTLLLRRPGVSFPELLRGPRSLGDLFNDRGIPAWPSSEHPSPDGAPFFSGGYTTQQHTCFIDNGGVNGVQLEAHWTGVRDTAANRNSFAGHFSRILQPYLYENYGYSLGSNAFHQLIGDSQRIEKGSGPFPMQVSREGFNSFSSSMAIEFGGSATQGVDFLVTNNSVSFSNGQTLANFSILPLTPNGDLGDKTIEVRLVPDYRQSTEERTVLLILGDGLSQTVTVAADTPSVMEGDGEAGFSLSRTSTEGSLSVNLEWAGAAVPGLDYDFGRDLPETVEFAPGAAEVQVTLTLVDDAIPEPNKDIFLRVLPGTGYRVGHNFEASIELIDDDAPVGSVVWYRGEIANNILLDSSGNEHHATTLPAGRGPTPIQTPDGKAISFDGVESTAALPKTRLDSAGGFSVGFHFRIDPSSSTPQHNFISFGRRGQAGSLNVYLFSATTLRTWLGTASSSSLDALGSWTDGTWRHYAVTVDANGITRVYINGQPVRLSTGWVAPLDPNEILWIGWQRGDGNASGFLGGYIRDFRVYDRALAPSEVTALATNRLNFDAWRRQQGLPFGASASADLDGDGLSLLLEYGLGSHPLSAGRPPRYDTRLDDGQLVLEFIQQPWARDLRWQVQATTDLTHSWETLAERSPNAVDWLVAPGVVLDQNEGLVQVRDKEGAAESNRRMMRLHLELTN
jgi:hypothetical protein